MMTMFTSSKRIAHKGILIACLLAPLFAGCGKSDEARDLAEIDAAQQGSTSDMAPVIGAGASSSSSAPPIEPVEVRADAFAIGTMMNPDGAVSGTKPVYSIGDTLHASVPVAGRPAGTKVKIYWTYQDGTSLKEESKQVDAGAKYLTFDFSKSNGMKAGSYMVQLDIGGMPSGLLDITVK